jgi:hypothetical protein
MDLELVETYNGGDLVKTAKDVSVINGFQNMPYIATFGGNVEASTPRKRLITEQDFSWWGNYNIQDSGIQINSQTERVLQRVALNSSGRMLIQQAIIKDLEFMRSFAEVAVDVKILATDVVAWGIKIRKPDNLQEREFIYIWDATVAELTFIPELGGGSIPIQFRSFDFTFDYTFE